MGWTLPLGADFSPLEGLEVSDLLTVAIEVAVKFGHGVAAKFFERAAGKRERHHGFRGHTRGGNYTNVGALVGGFDHLARLEVHRLQWTPQGRDRFQITTHDDVLSIRNAAFE